MPGVHLREHLLQQIWEKQYVVDHLVTHDGRPVRVEHPGRINLEPGPDIRNARIRIAGTLFAGDVEIHRTAQEWFSHGHHLDPRYNSVILHVLLHQAPSTALTRTHQGREVPMVSLEHALIRPLAELRKDALFDDLDVRSGRLRCSGQNGHVPADLLRQMLDRLAVERIEIKLRRFEERLHELAHERMRSVRETRYGWNEDPSGIPHPDPEISMMDLSRKDLWEQVFYEGCMEGLGYARNRMPFMRVGRVATLEMVRAHAASIIQSEALLFGVAGLLPAVQSVDDADARAYVHLLNREWRSLRSHVRSGCLSSSDWVLASGRPANSPYVRIVAARALIRKLIDQDLFLHILGSVKQQAKNPRSQLHRLLSVEPGPFWERRVSFHMISPGNVQPLGPARRDDLIINCIVPLCLLYARTFRDAAVRRGAISMLAACPPLQPNSITRRISLHLLGKKHPIQTAREHQAAIQLFQYYCSEGRCAECDVGKHIWDGGTDRLDDVSL